MRDVIVRGVDGRTNEQQYAIISPYFDGRIKMNEYIIFGQIIFQNFHQFKAFVGLSDRRIIATAPYLYYIMYTFRYISHR